MILSAYTKSKSFIYNVINETKATTWPTFNQTLNYSVAVALVAIALGLYIYALNVGFVEARAWLFNLVK